MAKFRDLYERARTAERHEKQFKASAASRQETSTPRPRNRSNPVKTVESEVSVSQRPNPNRGVRPTNRPCFSCKQPGHFARNCPDKKQSSEARGRTLPGPPSQSAVRAVEAASVVSSLTTQQLEELLAERRLQEESKGLEDNTASVSVVTVETSEEVAAIGPTMLLPVTVEGVGVEAVIDTASQSTIISRSFLHLIGQSL